MPSPYRLWHRWIALDDPLMSCPSDSGIDENRFWRFPLLHDSVEGFK